MTREQLVKRIKARRKNLGITIENLAKVSNLGAKTIMRFFAGDDVRISTLEKIINTLGVDFAGNEVVDIKTLREKKAQERALYIVSLAQDTSSLEQQGLNKNDINQMIEDTKEELLYGKYQKKLWTSW